MWNPISSVPLDRDLEVAVINQDGTHRLVFPCRRARDVWINSATGARVDIRPTHWRDWRWTDPPSEISPNPHL